MKKYLLLLCLTFFIHVFSFAQTPGEWVWMHGSIAPFSMGNYGVQGVASPTNEPPGVYEACDWTDLNGNFWTFGGYTSANFYNDLWKYDPLINEWTWMKGPGTINNAGSYGTLGISSPLNNPPFRACTATWTDHQGNLWLFGGYSGYSDLWKYTITTNEWTWVKGPSTTGSAGTFGVQGVPSAANNPSGRWETSTTWTDAAGDLWLFGGNNLNDLWRYHIATDEWTWMQGSNVGGQPAVYGTMGVEDILNTPGARRCYSRWKDIAGNLWLFGGSDGATPYNDLWRYNSVTNSWTWMSGSNAGGAAGMYGIKCVSNISNVPGARWENRSSWTDSNGNFFLFGGGGGTSITPVRNDLWEYCVTANRWTWLSGDSIGNPAGNWGVIGVSSPANKPDGRFGSIAGADNNGNIYMFGGYNSATGPCNDLWRYTIDPCCSACLSVPIENFTVNDSGICPYSCINITNLSQGYNSYLWYFPGGSPSSSTVFSPQNICYNNPGIYDVTLIATRCGGADTLTLTNYITVFTDPVAPAITQSGDTLFSQQIYVTYQWYLDSALISGATNYFYVAPASGNYNLVVTDDNGCEVGAGILNVIASLTPALFKGEGVSVFPNPANDALYITCYLLYEADIQLEIYNSLGEKVYAVTLSEAEAGKQQIINCKQFASGIYLLNIQTKGETASRKFMKE